MRRLIIALILLMAVPVLAEDAMRQITVVGLGRMEASITAVYAITN